MQVILADGSIHTVPEWFRNIPMLEEMFKFALDSEDPLPLPKIQNERELGLFIGALVPVYGDLQTLIKLLELLAWAQVDSALTQVKMVNGVATIVSGTQTAQLVNRLNYVEIDSIQGSWMESIST